MILLKRRTKASSPLMATKLLFLKRWQQNVSVFLVDLSRLCFPERVKSLIVLPARKFICREAKLVDRVVTPGFNNVIRRSSASEFAAKL